MSDNYQAVYDAVRSRFHGCDAGSAVESALRDAFGNVDHQIRCALQDITCAFSEHSRPCIVFKPVLSQDGDHWCVLYGENLQEGVAGFGPSPASAMADFDRAWHTNIPAMKAPHAQ